MSFICPILLLIISSLTCQWGAYNHQQRHHIHLSIILAVAWLRHEGGSLGIESERLGPSAYPILRPWFGYNHHVAKAQYHVVWPVARRQKCEVRGIDRITMGSVEIFPMESQSVFWEIRLHLFSRCECFLFNREKDKGSSGQHDDTRKQHAGNENVARGGHSLEQIYFC